MAVSVKQLRDLWDATVRESNKFELDKMEAQQKVAAQAARVSASGDAYNVALARALLEANCPPGYSLDVHGDGKLKPASECALPGGAPRPAPAPSKPNGAARPS